MKNPSQFFALNGMSFEDDNLFDRENIPSEYTFNSEVCRIDHFLRSNFTWWCRQMKEVPRFHRKTWEWYFISAALKERGLLQHGMRGLGFGVGTEPLPDAFASLGVEIVGTDQGIESATQHGWTTNAEHADGKQKLGGRSISDQQTFEKLVSFQTVDMNDIPTELSGFDFCWSSCCLEHLGSLQKGIDFIVKSLDTLKPGGYAVHTTEYNLNSDDETFEHPDLSIYRRQDIVKITKLLREAGHDVSPLNFYPGSHSLDRYIDLPPYNLDAHLRTLCGQFVITSIALIVRKSN